MRLQMAARSLTATDVEVFLTNGDVVREGAGGGEVLDLAGERIGEPGEPAHPHPHGEVLTLDV